MLLVADMSLAVFKLPQEGQGMAAERSMTSTSPTRPQSWHRISYIGMMITSGCPYSGFRLRR
jgi:hypothetical protein